MELEANKYKIYYYLNNLWSKKYINQIPQSSYLKNDKKILEYNNQNNLLSEYKCLLELFNSEIQYEKFVELFKKNINLIKKISYTKNFANYFDIGNINLKSEGDEKNNINVIIDLISNKDIESVYTYLHSPIEIKKAIIKEYSKSFVIPKNKSNKDFTNPENFRYYINHHNVIKIIDRLWCIKLLSYFNTYPIDNKIFKSYLIKNDFYQIIKLATKNTCELENKVILDISKAYDSVDWSILPRLVYSNLSKKINKNIAKELIDEYIILLTNRNVYYDNIFINMSSGIPLGLPSSNIIFHFILEEIILRWLNNNKNYLNYFIINIYVDDIYFEFNNSFGIIEINYLILNLMNYLRKFGFVINREKIKISPNIYTKKIGNLLVETDLYLGVPFTRNIQTFGLVILKLFNDRYFSNLTWSNIYNYILSNIKCSNALISFFCFKLKPIIGNYINKKILLEFIKINYLKS